MDPDAKRAAILSCGENMFAQQGYTGTTMADIAESADVAVGTVYRLFPDKPSLLAALHAKMEDDFIAGMVAGWNSVGAYADKFGPMIDALFRQAEIVYEIMPLYSMTKDVVGATDYVPGAKMISTIETLYAEGVDAGALRAFPPGIHAYLAHGLVEGGMRAWMANPSESMRALIVQELEAVFRRLFV